MQQLSGASFSLRADCTKGAVHAFQAETDDEAAAWVDALWAHAGYCDELNELFQAGGTSAVVRKQFLNVMMKRGSVSVAKVDGQVGHALSAPLVLSRVDDVSARGHADVVEDH